MDAVSNTSIELTPAGLAAGENQLTGFIDACRSSNHNLVGRYLRSMPELAVFGIHDACLREDIKMIRIMVRACPQCISVTNLLGQTPLHVAAQRGNVPVFQVLFEGLYVQYSRDDILNLKDSAGNAALHYATKGELYQVLSWLLNDELTGSPLAEVNSLDENEFTALDLHLHNPASRAYGEIATLLLGAGAKRAQPFCPITPRSHSQTHSKILGAISAMVVAAAYSGIFNLNDATASTSEAFSFAELLFHPGLLPDFFYTVMFMMVAFVAGLTGLIVASWFHVRKLPLFLQALSLLGMGSLLWSYVLMVQKKLPQFYITTEVFNVSSFLLVWLYAPILVLFVLLMLQLPGICRRLIIYDTTT